MKVKKIIGCCVVAITAMLVNVGNASMATVGVEEMPESMKNSR